MNIKIKQICAVTYILFIFSSLCFIFFISSKYNLSVSGDVGKVRSVSSIIHEKGSGEYETITLPVKFKNLDPRTAITLLAEVQAGSRESLLIKSVFSPLRLYINEVMVYESGQGGTYPFFMNDPPTIISSVELPENQSNISLRIEYLSPIGRSELSVPELYIGQNSALLTHQFYEDGFSFLFSLLLIFIGLVMIIVSLTMIVHISAGASFIWLGLFSLASGVWGFGECDLSAFFLPFPSLLHVMSYLGLFTLSIPFQHFGLTMLKPKNKLPMQIILWIHYISLAITLLLQIFSITDFTKSLYWFHIIAPLGFVTFAACLLWEHFRHRNPAAKRFGPAIIILASAVILELANYWLHFTDTLTLFFQLGVLAFVISLGIVSGYYVRESIKTSAEKVQLEYEMASVNRQLDLQRIQYRKLTENDETVKAQRHDLRHQLTVLRELNLKSNTEKLDNYINTLIEKIPSERISLLCENYAVNAVASHYFLLAKMNGIDISVKLAIPAEINSTLESDLCIIVGNLLENAFEACSRMNSGTKSINLNSRIQYGGTLTLTLDNSFDGKTRQQNGVFLSSKRNEIGIGLSSVKAVVEKYGGTARFETENKIFRSSVYIKLDEQI